VQAGTVWLEVAAAIAGADDQALAEALGERGAGRGGPSRCRVLAVRPSWVRVQRRRWHVLFEKILDAGERYVVPPWKNPPCSGTGQFRLDLLRRERADLWPGRARRAGGQERGPVARGADPDSYAVADLTVPMTIWRDLPGGCAGPSGAVLPRTPARIVACPAALSRPLTPAGGHPMTHNPIRPWRNIDRRKSRQIRVGKVLVGGDAPISVQTMTNTLTTDVAATIEQIQRCAVAGADIVRVSTPDEESTRALREIVRRKPGADRGRHPFPLQTRHRGGRGGGGLPADQPRQHRRRPRVREVVKAAKDHGCSIRIGVNAGSRWKSTCWRNTASLAPMRWWNPASTISSCCRTTISRIQDFR
jgi:hypothetical protein